MDKKQLVEWIAERYSVDAEYPWANDPVDAVFRHQNNRKWFALMMQIPKNKLGLAGTELIDILNVKCDPLLIGSLRQEPGIYSAYHMNKAHWITVVLDGSVEDDKIKWLLEMSYDLTAVKKKAK